MKPAANKTLHWIPIPLRSMPTSGRNRGREDPLPGRPYPSPSLCSKALVVRTRSVLRPIDRL